MSLDLEGLARRLAVVEMELSSCESASSSLVQVEEPKSGESNASLSLEENPIVVPPPIRQVPRVQKEEKLSVEDTFSWSSAAPPRFKESVNLTNNWEQFMGAKLFAWIGGLALFLGIALFVKYSFEHDLISPAARASIGFLSGLGLLAGGLIMRRRETVITAQTLSATGILVLYAVTYSCRAYYHLEFFDTLPTFLVMTLITSVAILVSIRMNAVFVAVLGIAGGFLSPILISTGEDTPLLLFGYIALLDIGLLAVALRQQWRALPLLGAVGTIATQAGWIAEFFDKNQYVYGNRVLIVMGIFAGFFALFLGATGVAKYYGRLNQHFSMTTCWLGFSAIGAALFLLLFPSLGERPLLLFGYVFLIDLGFLALSLLDERRGSTQLRIGVSVFGLLGLWTSTYLSDAHLYAALSLYFIFALFHSAAPVILHRWKARPLSIWCTLFPALSLLFVLMPLCKLAVLSFAIWPLILLVDLIAIGLALALAELLPLLVVMLITLGVLGVWILKIPTDLAGFSTSLFMLGGFSLFFLGGAIWVSRMLLLSPQNAGAQSKLARQIPAMSAILPFLLLLMLTLRLGLLNPSPVFGVALLLLLLLLGLARFFAFESLCVVALGCIAALEYIWHLQCFGRFHFFVPDRTLLPLSWYLLFYGVFSLFPFLFRRHFEASRTPWAVAVLAGPAQFFLIEDLVRVAYPGLHGMMGVLPAIFAVPSLIGLWVLVKRMPFDSPARNSQLAWFGGVALLFITLIFPMQFDRQWITLGWALEGAALCWLFHKVPHRGLPLAGCLLLIASFVRLSLNPEVLSYHACSGIPFWNWYLYTYAVTALTLFTAAHLLAPPRNRVAGENTPPLLWTLGAILCFLLLNIEIADYFSTPGSLTLTFDFEGNFARDLSYSITWALFALVLLIIGIVKRVAAVRYAGISLLAVVLGKLFFHDLSTLDQLYRIAAFIVVAVIAILASFLYQRFLVPIRKTNDF